MKVLYFIESLRPGGKERRLVELMKAISQQKDYNCKLVILENNMHYKEQIPKNIEIRILLRRYGKKDISIFIKFYKICLEFRPDIIHVWGNMPAFYSIPSKLILNIPLINSQITNAPENLPKGILSHKLPFKFSDHILANSAAGMNIYNPPKTKSSIIHNGFDFSRIRQIKSKEFIKNHYQIKTKYVIGMVATFSDLKDYNTYIKAANLVLNKFPDTTFLCIGDGNSTIFEKNVIPAYSNKFKFLTKQDDIESIVNIFDIGVLATFTEGISNSIIEYMALAKPVIATDGGGTSELVNNNITGFLVPVKSEKILAEKIIFLLSNPQQGKLMGEAGKLRIINEFSMENMVNKHIEIYSRFIPN